MNAPIPPPPPETAVSRLKDRLLHPRSRSRDEPSSHLPIVAPPRALGFPASIAEFLLVLRLRARRRSALCSDMLERALHVVLVTCKNWFAASDSNQPGPRKPD
jgi:hypothetical protein